MNWEIVWTRSARVDLRRLDQQVVRRVNDSLERFAATGQGDVVRLTSTDEWRLRVGDWRVRFTNEVVTRPAEPPAPDPVRVRVIQVLRVLPRGRAYRD